MYVKNLMKVKICFYIIMLMEKIRVIFKINWKSIIDKDVVFLFELGILKVINLEEWRDLKIEESIL